MTRPLRPETLRRKADDIERLGLREHAIRVSRTYRECADRISQLEDTIDLAQAKRDVDESRGENTHALGIVEEIAARRGKGWRGAKTLRQRTEVTRDHMGQPYCESCQWFHPPDKHDPVCATCGCAHEYHDGPSGQCTNGAPGWSCDCRRYQLAVSPRATAT